MFSELGRHKNGIKFCPHCGSEDVFFASGLPQMWSIWECRRCGCRSPIVVEDGELGLRLREDWKKGHKNH